MAREKKDKFARALEVERRMGEHLSPNQMHFIIERPSN